MFSMSSCPKWTCEINSANVENVPPGMLGRRERQRKRNRGYDVKEKKEKKLRRRRITER